MKRILTSSSMIGMLFWLFFSASLAADVPPAKEDLLQKTNLAIPNSPEEKNYLGLSGSGNFRIPQIKADLVLIEIFSMYCPYCQADAPKINELYQLIEKDPALKNKIKMIGIGAGNTPFEVEVFKKTYQVPFPLFPDKDFVVHKIWGEPRTPYFVIAKINADRTYQILHTQLGNFPGAEPFLELVLKASGLK
ncbi:MAG: peroxiredoxin family protein [Thermodesulfobacteriota bacterium]